MDFIEINYDNNAKMLNITVKGFIISDSLPVRNRMFKRFRTKKPINSLFTYAALSKIL